MTLLAEAALHLVVVEAVERRDVLRLDLVERRPDLVLVVGGARHQRAEHRAATPESTWATQSGSVPSARSASTSVPWGNTISGIR